ncbi:MAG: hypothetical protein U0263_40895 [Polyangiaceae bacterium]
MAARFVVADLVRPRHGAPAVVRWLVAPDPDAPDARAGEGRIELGGGDATTAWALALPGALPRSSGAPDLRRGAGAGAGWRDAGAPSVSRGATGW